MRTQNRNVRKGRHSQRAATLERKRITKPVRGNDALSAILKQRGSVYGDFAENARIAQAFKNIARNSPGWNSLSNVQKEAMDLDFTKNSRILTANPGYGDNWRDKAGYATLAADRCDNG